MNEITRKAANALIATVDFFQGALAAEAQAGEAKQVQLDAFAGQLRDQIKADEEACGLMQEEIGDLRKHRDELETCVFRLKSERDSLLSENCALREVALRARGLLPLKPGTKNFDKARALLARDLKALDG